MSGNRKVFRAKSSRVITISAAALVFVFLLSCEACLGYTARIEGTLRPFVGGSGASSSEGLPTIADMKTDSLKIVEENNILPAEKARAVARAILAERAGTGSTRQFLVPGDMNEDSVINIPRGTGHSGFPVPKWPENEAFVPGYLVVRFADDLKIDANTSEGMNDVENLLNLLSDYPDLSDYRFTAGVWGGPDILALRINDINNPQREINHRETEAVLELLQGRHYFEYVELNWWRWAFSRPNDEHYGLQWHYTQIAMESAWQLTTGSSSVTVAVIDDGVNPHADISGRLLPGYDMVSDPTNGCSSGRSSNSRQKPNCGPGGYSMWHGMHVAGTIGASTNNGSGLAGVDWAARILPVRVLGLYGGSNIDIIAGIHWSVGIDVPNVPTNPNTAHVINMSLGGGPLGQADQDAVNNAVRQGAIVVVAAGNDNKNPRGEAFSSADNVIVVGATDYLGSRAPYSNYGELIDVMAPGGNTEVDMNADGYVDGVLSLYLDATGTESTYEFHQGTSMAAPHVAGIAALMKSVNPTLTHAQAEQILKDTADRGGRCSEGCGSGIVRPAAAIRAAAELGGGSVQEPTGPAQLAVSSERVNIGGNESGQFTVFNTGGESLTWRLDAEGALASSISLTGVSSGRLEPGESQIARFSVIRSGLQDGTHQAIIRCSGNANQVTVAVIFRVGAAPDTDVGNILIGTFMLDDDGDLIIGGAGEVDASSGYSYSFSSEPGPWFVIAVQDSGGDDGLQPGDLWGIYRSLDNPVLLELEDFDTLKGIDFALVPFTDIDDFGEVPCGALRSCWEGCGGNDACMDACPIDAACEQCWIDRVQSCASQEGCGNDINCICTKCEHAVDACFGPYACGGGGGGGNGGSSAGVGHYCTAATGCASPYQCDTSVDGGYCTANCSGPGDCPGGMCIQDDEAGIALCLATCTGAGTCPRPSDGCYDVGEPLGVCFPDE